MLAVDDIAFDEILENPAMKPNNFSFNLSSNMAMDERGYEVGNMCKLLHRRLYRSQVTMACKGLEAQRRQILKKTNFKINLFDLYS